MAVTGLAMIAFLLVHMYGNLKMFVSYEAYDHYAHWLKTDLLYPLLPQGWFIWIFRFALLACIVAHIYAAAVLTLRAHGARSTKYVTTDRIQQTYAARTMRWGGVIIVGFLVFHLLQFTIIPAKFGGDPAHPHTMVVAAFEQWWMVLIYLVSMILVCMHVRHGIWSALTTLGANTSPTARRVLNLVAYVVAIVLFVGFMTPPLAIFFGII